MEKTLHKSKYLIIDASGWEPLRISLLNGDIKASELNDFFLQANIKPVITKTAYLGREFNFSEQPTIFDAYETWFLNSLNDDTLIENRVIYTSSTSVQSNGTLAMANMYNSDESLSSNSLDILVLDDTISQQGSLWEMGGSWQKLENPDRSVVSLARHLCSTGSHVAILANDWELRSQCSYEGIEVYGTASLLAGLVFSDITYQKATKIFYKWEKYDKKFIPKKSFKEVLEIEYNRKKENKSFWIN